LPDGVCKGSSPQLLKDQVKGTEWRPSRHVFINHHVFSPRFIEERGGSTITHLRNEPGAGQRGQSTGEEPDTTGGSGHQDRSGQEASTVLEGVKRGEPSHR
jgi:hypothetical protein